MVSLWVADGEIAVTLRMTRLRECDALNLNAEALAKDIESTYKWGRRHKLECKSLNQRLDDLDLRFTMLQETNARLEADVAGSKMANDNVQETSARLEALPV